MPKIKRKRCKSCGMLPRRGKGLLDDLAKKIKEQKEKGEYRVAFPAVLPPGDSVWVYDKDSKGNIIGRHAEPKNKISDSIYTPQKEYKPKSGPKQPAFDNREGDSGYLLKNGQWYKNSFAGLKPVNESSVPARIRAEVGGALSGLVSKRQMKALKREG